MEDQRTAGSDPTSGQDGFCWVPLGSVVSRALSRCVLVFLETSRLVMEQHAAAAAAAEVLIGPGCENNEPINTDFKAADETRTSNRF